MGEGRQGEGFSIFAFQSINNISWEILYPDENGDWLNKRNPNFASFMAIGDKKKIEKYSVWNNNFATGLETSRDPWMYSFSEAQVCNKANAMADFYNIETERCADLYAQAIYAHELQGTQKEKEPDPPFKTRMIVLLKVIRLWIQNLNSKRLYLSIYVKYTDLLKF